MMDGEDHQEMYRRLKAIATTFKNLGAHHIDDEWIKMKYILALTPYEPADVKSVQGKNNFHEMTSNQVMQEIQAYKVAAQNVEDARARALGMQRSSNLALKASVIEKEVPLQASIEGRLEMYPEDMRHEYHEHMAFYRKTFWADPHKAKEDNQRRSKSSGFQMSDNNGQRVRTCYNCNDRFHFVDECPYEKREDHGGKLIFKSKTKSPSKKPFVKKGGPKKKQPKFVFLTQEEYSGSESDEEETSTSEMAAIATTSTSSASLFESPNEDSLIKNVKCLMAKSSKDYASGGSKWVLDSGCTSHMTGSKKIMTEMRPNVNNIIVTYGDMSQSEVLGLGKVVVAPDISLVDVMLVETLGYNLLSVHTLGKMGFAVFIDNEIVVLL
jgi:hypothetical protein